MAGRSPSDLEEFYIESRTKRFFRRQLRRIRRLFMLLLVALIALVVFAPTILSSPKGREYLLKTANRYIPGDVSVESMYLSWFGTQSFGGLELRGTDKRLVLRVGELRLDQGLVPMLTKRRSVGSVEMINPVATLVYGEDGRSNLQDALGTKKAIVEAPMIRRQASKSEQHVKVRLPMTGTITLRSGQLTLVQEEIDRIVFSAIEGRVQFAQRTGPLVVMLNGKSKQRDLTGEFDIDVVATGFDPSGEFRLVPKDSGLYKTAVGSELNVKARLANLPLEGIDQLLALKYPQHRGFLTAALGKRMDLVASVFIDPKELQLDIEVLSPTLKGNMKGGTNQGLFSLTEPGSFTLEVTPTLFDYVSEAIRLPDSIRLRKTSILQTDVEALSVPFDASGVVLPKLAVAFRADFEDAQLVGDAAFGEVELKNTHAVVVTEELEKQLNVAFKSDLFYKKNFAEIEAKMNLHEVFDGLGRFNMESAKGDLTLGAKDVPVRVIDEWAGFQGVLVEALGNSVNLSVGTDLQGSDHKLTVGMDSETISFEGAKLRLTDRITLEQPVALQYQLGPQLINRFLDKHWGVKAKDVTGLRVFIEEMSMPMLQRGRYRTSFENLQVQGRVSADALHVTGIPDIGGVKFHDFEFQMSGERLDTASISFNGKATPDKLESWVQETAGASFDFKGSTELAGDPDTGMDFLDTQLTVSSDRLNFQAVGHFLEYKTVRLIEPVVLDFNLLPRMSQELGLDETELPRLAKPSRIALKLDPFDITFGDFDLYESRLTGMVAFDEVVLEFTHVDYQSTLTEGSVDWVFDGPKNRTELNILARAETVEQGDSQNGRFELQLTVDQLLHKGRVDFYRSDLELKARADRLPVPFLEAISRQAEIHKLFGPEISGFFKLRLTEMLPPKGGVTFALEGTDISTQGAFVIDEMLRLPSKDQAFLFQWKISPERFAVARRILTHLHKEAGAAVEDLQLIEPTEVSMRLKDFSLPLAWFYKPLGSVKKLVVEDKVIAKDAWDPDLLKLDVDLELTNLRLRDPRLRQTLSFERFKGFVVMPSVRDRLTFGVSAQGQLEGVGNGSKLTEIVVKGQLWDLLGEDERSLDLKEASGELWGVIDDLPVLLIGDFFAVSDTVRDHLQALFGDTLNASAKADLDRMSGPVELRLDSSNLRGAIVGELIEGVLNLKEEAALDLKVTPEMGAQILRYLSPLMISAISSDEPIRLRIKPVGFELPIVPLDMANANMDDVEVRLGTIRMRNSGPIGSLVKVLELTRFTKKRELEVQFTPLFISMKSGIITAKRMDFLVANNFHMASWGRIDLANHRLAVIAGMTGETLRNAFKVKGLPDSYVMQFMIDGTPQKPSFDEAKAAAKVAGLYLRAYGGDRSRLLDGIIEKVSASDGNAPAPTTDPLPWVNRDPLQVGEQEYQTNQGHPSNKFEEQREDSEVEKYREYEKIQKGVRRYNKLIRKLWN